MQFLRALFVFVTLLSSAKGFAIGSTVVDPDHFYKGARWIWSYSERGDQKGEWQDPYLYEVYEVVHVDGPQVTIEMSSRSNLFEPTAAHHKFIVDINKCLASGKKRTKFNRFRIEFYTKSFGKGWTLLAKKHKALAFTEKFNCFSGSLDFEVKDLPIGGGEKVLAFRWEGLALNSWYSADDSSEMQAVMLERRSNEILVQMLTQSI